MSGQVEADLFRRLTAQIVAAHLAHNKLEVAEVPPLIETVHKTLAGLGKTPDEPVRPEPAVPIRKSIFPDYIVCLEDGKKLKMLKRHLKTAYDLTPDQYPGEMGTEPRLPHGGAQLRRTPLVAGQENRAGAPAGPGAAGAGGGEGSGEARA